MPLPAPITRQVHAILATPGKEWTEEDLCTVLRWTCTAPNTRFLLSRVTETLRRLGVRAALREHARDCLQAFYLGFLEKGLQQPFVQRYDPASAGRPSECEARENADSVRVFSNYFVGHPRHSPLMRFVREWARRQRRLQSRSARVKRDDTTNLILRIAGPSRDPAEDTAHTKLLALIQEFLATERPRVRVIFALHELEEWSYAEVRAWYAETYGHDISEVHARVIAHGVRQRLRAFLAARGYSL